MYRIYLLKIKEALKSKLKGDISVHINNDTLIISVFNGYLNYQRTYYNLSSKICQGCPIDLFVSDFISHFKQSIYKSIFKHI